MKRPDRPNGHHIIKDEDGCEIRTAPEEFLHGLVTAFVASIPVGKRLRGQFDPDLSQFLSKANNTKWFVRYEWMSSFQEGQRVVAVRVKVAVARIS